MRARERDPTPQPPGSSSASLALVDPYTALSVQLREHDLKMTKIFERIEYRV